MVIIRNVNYPLTTKRYGENIDCNILILSILFTIYVHCLSNPHKKHKVSAQREVNSGLI